MFDIAETTTFEWGRINSGVDWIAPLMVLALLLSYVVWMYRRDAAELGPLRGSVLLLLRCGVMCLLVGIYLQPQWRNEQTLARNAKLHLLVDTSLSMGMSDAADTDGASTDALSRSQRIAQSLTSEDWVQRLRDRHDVVVSTFDKDVRTVVALGRRTYSDDPETISGAMVEASSDDTQLADVADAEKDREAPDAGESDTDTGGNDARSDHVDWTGQLAARGDQSRLGDALAKLVDASGATPVAGIIVVSDGAENAGLAAEIAAQSAGDAGIPIFPVGVGSAAETSQVRIAELEVPHRAYPGDRFVVTGYVQAFGMAGQSSVATLYIQSGAEPTGAEDDAKPDSAELVESQTITLGADGELLPVRFEVAPTSLGRQTLRMTVASPNAADNGSAASPGTATESAAIDVVERRTRVLLFAGGPTREYQFVRGVLWRDAEVTVDVLLQTAQSGMAQDADSVLASFPDTAETLLPYDVIVAFDPDWRKLNSHQLELLETWVGKQAGGLVMIAGDVYTDRCAQDSSLDAVRDLAPVEFFERFSIAESLRPQRTARWPIELSEAGRDSEALWIDESRSSSLTAWERFDGVFASHRLRGVKPGAIVYARHVGPDTGIAAQATPFLVEHFFGSGRVFYIGSGELWRWRRLDEGYFERFYTKLIRHVSQGRLHRGASGGVLLTEKDRYGVGQTVAVHAQLKDERGEPYQAAEADLTIVAPGGDLETVTLADDGERLGNFAGQFTPSREGTYRLMAFASDESRRVSRAIQVKLPDVERQYSMRNDALLERVAERSGGHYFVGLDEAFGRGAAAPIWQRIEDRTQYVVQQLAPTQLWDNSWFMLALCGLLCTEWTIRRLARLA
ncbi:MAG: hypothetical protein R3C10_11985 [Pirellulales bacterium]